MSAADLVHGGALDAMRRAFPDVSESWIELSTGINPWPYPTDGVAVEDWARLPTASAFEACARAMAGAFGADRTAVLPVAGTELAIRLLPLIVPAETVAIMGPTYDDHRRSWRAAGRTVRPCATLDAAIGDVQAVVLCNPNNPDGRTVEAETILRAARTMAARGGWLIVDEAYAELRPELSVAAWAGGPGLIVLRSFGKFYGLGGLRLGAVLAPAAVLDPLAALLGGWNVSGPALRLGARAYADEDWRDATLGRLRAAASDLHERLTTTGLEVAGGTLLFTLARADDAAERWRRLAEAGVYARRFAHDPDLLRFGLPATAADADRLSAALNL